MKSSIKSFIVLAMLVVGIVAILPSPDAFAQFQDARDGIDSISDESSPDLMVLVKNGINTLLFLIGAVSVVMIIYGGFKYVTSSGESSAVSSAKNTILYAVVGLVVALSAYAIASFVLGAFNSSAPTDRQTSGSSGAGPTPGPSQPQVDPYGGNGPRP